MNLCEETGVLKITYLALTFVNIIKIAAPIILIIMGSIDLFKAVSGGEEELKKAGKAMLNRFIAAVIVFFVPTIVGLIINILSNSISTLNVCVNNLNLNTIDKLDDLADEVEDKKTPPDDDTDDDDDGDVPKEDVETVQLIVGTWNIGHGRKYSGITASKLAAAIKNNKIDMIGVQEASGNGSSLIEQITPLANMNTNFYTSTPAGNAIISKNTFTSKSSSNLVSCHERRALQKTVINIKGKNISFYNTHISYQQECRAKQIKDVYNKIKSDTNPTIVVGDFNVATNCSVIINNIGSNYSIIAYDTVEPNRIKCTDSIIISNNRNIKVLSNTTIKTHGTLSDHNLVTAKLQIQTN